MKLEKAPQETYADIGGLDNQIQEIKVRERKKWEWHNAIKNKQTKNSHMFGFVLLSFLVHVLLNWFVELVLLYCSLMLFIMFSSNDMQYLIHSLCVCVSRNLWSCRWLTQSTMRRWASSHPRVSFSMVHQAQVSWEQNTMSSQARHCIYVSLWNSQQQIGLKGTLYFSCSGQQRCA